MTPQNTEQDLDNGMIIDTVPVTRNQSKLEQEGSNKTETDPSILTGIED